MAVDPPNGYYGEEAALFIARENAFWAQVNARRDAEEAAARSQNPMPPRRWIGNDGLTMEEREGL